MELDSFGSAAALATIRGENSKDSVRRPVQPFIKPLGGSSFPTFAQMLVSCCSRFENNCSDSTAFEIPSEFVTSFNKLAHPIWHEGTKNIPVLCY